MASTSTPQKAAKPKDRNGEPPVKKWASPASWDRYRARITHLYTTEGKTLNEVMAIMAAEQGHHATYIPNPIHVRKLNAGADI